MPLVRLHVRFISCVLAAGLASLGRGAEPPVITVRVIDARNGRPYAKFGVWIILHRVKDPGAAGFDSEAEARAFVVARFLKTTDAKGELSFSLPSPLPEEIYIEDVPFGCGPGLFDTRQVIEQGIVGENNCRTKLRKMNVRFRAGPGQVVVFAAPIGFWEGIFLK